jgi:CRISPR-associated protein (TIGR03984 family)
MISRTIQEIASSVNPLEVPNDLDPEPFRVWLTEQAKTHKLRWLLAHTDCGVIWGAMRDDGLRLSCEAFADEFPGVWLDRATLQQGRLFGEDGELLLWQGGQGLQAILRRDSAGESTTLYLDEAHLLWGNRKRGEHDDGFILLAEGSQGIVHAPPLENAPGDKKRAALHVRHYLTEEEATGLLRITASRLVKILEPEKRACPAQPARKGGN